MNAKKESIFGKPIEDQDSAFNKKPEEVKDKKADDKKEKGRDQLLFYPGPGFDGMVSVVKSLDNGIKTIGRKNNSQE